MSQSIASEDRVIELARRLGKRVPQIAKNPNNPWTAAVWKAFKEIADRQHGGLYSGQKHWKLYPERGPCKGEYLLDFVLWEEEYGPRIVCESQWLYSRGDRDIDWAFDKLRCVKGDIKVLIYESKDEPNGSQPPDRVRKVVVGYLKDLALLSTDEAFLLLHFSSKNPPWAHWWKPGRQRNFEFKPIPLQ